MRKLFIVLLLMVSNQINSTECLSIKNDDVYSKKAYIKEATLIIEKGKKELRSILPSLIDEQIDVYKRFVEDISDLPSLYNSNKKIEKKTSELTEQANLELFFVELTILDYYYKITNELLELNDDYFNYYTEHDLSIDFVDYNPVQDEVAPPIIIRKDVLDKIKELIKEEDIRLDNEKDQLYLDVFLAVVSFTAVGVSIQTINKLNKIAKLSSRGIRLSRNASSIEKIAYRALRNNPKLVASVKNTLSNQNKRDNVCRMSQYLEPMVSTSIVAIPYASGYAVGSLLESYKSENNELNGRLGDFSDGILTQPIGKLRIIMETNSDLIPN